MQLEKQLQQDARIEKAKNEQLQKDVTYLKRKVRLWENREREAKRMEIKRRLDMEERKRRDDEIIRRVRIEELEREKTRMEIVQRRKRARKDWY